MIRFIIVSILAFTTTYANPPVCTASEYARMVCQTVYINGKPVQECKWVCLPLSGAGR